MITSAGFAVCAVYLHKLEVELAEAGSNIFRTQTSGRIRLKHLFVPANQQSNKIKILFLGQCIAAGYNVGVSNAYPVLTMAMLSTRFPTLNFEIDFRPMLHPSGLKSLLKASLFLNPDIIFLSLPAIFAATPFRVNSLYLLSPEIMNVARSFVQKLETAVRTDSRFAKLLNKKSALMPTVVRPAVGVNDYERLIEDAVTSFQTLSDCRIVLMGPGGFNEDTKDGDELSPELFKSINEMIINLGIRLGVLVMNANDMMAEQDGSVFLRDNQRWSDDGHKIMAQELTSVLAAEIVKLRFNIAS